MGVANSVDPGAVGVANSVDPGAVGVHCLPVPVCLYISGKHSNLTL